jgi:hypothetical protein
LIDEVNALSDRAKSFYDHRTIHDAPRKLEYWRKECHQKIDEFFERKIQELDQLIAARNSCSNTIENDEIHSRTRNNST